MAISEQEGGLLVATIKCALWAEPRRINQRTSWQILMCCRRGGITLRECGKALLNCAVRSRINVISLGDATSAKVTLKSNTIYQEVHDGGGLIAAPETTPIEVVAMGNIFHHRSQRDFLSIPNWRQHLGKTLRWDGKDNHRGDLRPHRSPTLRSSMLISS